MFLSFSISATVIRIKQAQGKLYVDGVLTSSAYLSTSQLVEVKGDQDFVQFKLPNSSRVLLKKGRIKLKALKALRTNLLLEKGSLLLNVRVSKGQYFDLSTRFMRLELTSGHYYINHDSNRTYLAVFSGEAIYVNGVERKKIGQFDDLKVSKTPPAVKGSIPQTIWVHSRESFKQIGAIVP